jgi:hypothetical protein
MGFIEKRIALIHCKPLLLNLILTNHVPIVILVGTVQIIDFDMPPSSLLDPKWVQLCGKAEMTGT